MSLLVDSHCHLDFPELAADIAGIRQRMAANGVAWALCPGVTLERLPSVLALAEQNENIFAAVGVHPDTQGEAEPDVATLVEAGRAAKVVAIGETGLDYYRLEGDAEWQRERFRRHIAAAKELKKPLIVHCRAAAADTLRILREEQADTVGGVFHCFTEDDETARQALDIGFMISFSGILTFKNASAVRNVAQFVPLDRVLVETDAPYLAPAPHRGKTNEPAFVRFVAEELAKVKALSFDEIAEATTGNFFSLFSTAANFR